VDRVKNLPGYFRGIARARYIVRRLFRIIDEQARRAGLDPLQHQALIQIFGAGEELLRINDVAERLDIAPAFASRLTRELESKGYITRHSSEEDRRITLVSTSEEGQKKLTEIDQNVHIHVRYFHSQLSTDERAAALTIFAFYVGVPLESGNFRALMELVATATNPTRPDTLS
jgi:DNA-binding MarR family transcriptional regulator